MITRTIKDTTIEFISEFEAEAFDIFIELMEKTFVKKESSSIDDRLKLKDLNIKYRKPDDKFFEFPICTLLYMLMDLGSYFLFFIDNIYESYGLKPRNLKFNYHVYDNVLVIVYNDDPENKEWEKIIIKDVFDVILDENSFVWEDGNNNILKYDIKIKKFIDVSKLNGNNFIGKYNLNYRNLYQEEVYLLDYIITLLKENIDHLYDIDCKKIMNNIIVDPNISGILSYEKNYINIDNDDFELNITSDSMGFSFTYTRNNYKHHFADDKTKSQFHISLDKDAKINEMSYKNINFLYFQIYDYERKDSNTVNPINEMTYDFDKIYEV